ncbi:MAG: PilZ domain-containing protein [Xanthomonadales bacterium]|nr:PilZ domain-containing protein [Xanthomonadales bacterium]
MNEDRRRDSRLGMYAGVFMTHGEQAYLSELVNVSAGGVTVQRPTNWQSDHGGIYSLYFVLDQERIWCIKCAVAHEQEEVLGFSFQPGYAVKADQLLAESRNWR